MATGKRLLENVQIISSPPQARSVLEAMIETGKVRDDVGAILQILPDLAERKRYREKIGTILQETQMGLRHTKSGKPKRSQRRFRGRVA